MTCDGAIPPDRAFPDKFFVLDAGFDRAEGERRGRTFLRHPADGLRLIGIESENIEKLEDIDSFLTKYF